MLSSNSVFFSSLRDSPYLLLFEMDTQSSVPWGNIMKAPQSSIAPGPPNNNVNPTVNAKSREKAAKKVTQKLSQINGCESIGSKSSREVSNGDATSEGAQ